MARKSDPDAVIHKSIYGVFLPIPWADVHEITVHKDDITYTGYGWSREEAYMHDGDKYREGKKNK